MQNPLDIIKVAIIGGSGLSHYFNSDHISSSNKPQCFKLDKQLDDIDTPYGTVSGVCSIAANKPNNIFFNSHNILYFLPRHGPGHSIAPHKINYRANIYALKSLGVTHIISTNAVGGIAQNCCPQTIVIPDQILDYTWGREHTFFDDFSKQLEHIDFSYPFKGLANKALIKAAHRTETNKNFLDVINNGTYGCTQGPRLETAAEIKKMKAEGCTVVGMTAMPEASLAREKSIDYASVCMVVNWAAGLQSDEVQMQEIMHNLSVLSDITLELICTSLPILITQ